MPSFEDQLMRKVDIPQPPKKIISLVPSQTELLHYYELDKEVIGITKFCIHPAEWFRTKTRVGGTKQVDIEKVKKLQPDLIIANKEENVKEQIALLENDFPVWVSDVCDLPTAYEMMVQIGHLTGKKDKAEELINQLQYLFQQHKPSGPFGIKTAYLIWKDPYMTVGGDTFIHQMLLYNGFENIFADKDRYPTLSVADLIERNCQLLLLSSEPYPFKQKHIEELQALLPQTKILLVDGEFFSWYGNRLLGAPTYFDALRCRVLES